MLAPSNLVEGKHEKQLELDAGLAGCWMCEMLRLSVLIRILVPAFLPASKQTLHCTV
jgi:hypothetical protein